MNNLHPNEDELKRLEILKGRYERNRVTLKILLAALIISLASLIASIIVFLRS